MSTGHPLHGNAALELEAHAMVTHALDHFAARLTRVEVYCLDEEGPSERDATVRCLIEAFPTGHRPVSVRHRAASVRMAIAGAVEKLDHRLQWLFRRLGMPGPARPTDGEGEA